MLAKRYTTAPEFTYESSTSAVQRRGYWAVYATKGPAKLDAVCAPNASSREYLGIIIDKIKAGRNPDEFDFSGLSLKGADLRGLDLRVLGANALRQIDFTGANLGKQNFRGLNLMGAKFSGANLTGTDFEGARLEGAHFEKAQVSGCSFFQANATGAFMREVRASGANFEGTFRGADMAGAYIPYCYFGEGSNFRNVNLCGADLTGACLTYGEPSFAGAQMRGAALNGDFKKANFAGADLRGALLGVGSFDGANFAGANITDADISGASMTGARLVDAIDFTRQLEIAIPKPSFGSIYVALKALAKQLTETPTAKIIPLNASASRQKAVMRNVMSHFPVPGFAG